MRTGQFRCVSSAARPHAVRAFSLIEMSIALVVVALVVAGIMGGSKLMQISTVSGLAKEMQELKKAAVEFQTEYASIPGDMPDAVEKLSCTGCNGNGNGRLDDENERKLFWYHLSLTKKIPQQMDFTSNTFGVAYPESRNISAAYWRVVSDAFGVRVELARESATLGGVLSPVDALKIDEALDDWSPVNGMVTVSAVSGLDPLKCWDTAKSLQTKYNLANNVPDCTISFTLLGKPQLAYYFQRTPSGTCGGGTAAWTSGSWGACSNAIQNRIVNCTVSAQSTQNYTVACLDGDTAAVVANSKCAPMTAPPMAETCPTPCSGAAPASSRACPGTWNSGAWGSCTSGTQTRTVTCSTGTTTDCDPATKPALTQACVAYTGTWNTGAWTACSSGNQTRTVTCSTGNPADCDPAIQPIASQTCTCSNVTSNTGCGTETRDCMGNLISSTVKPMCKYCWGPAYNSFGKAIWVMDSESIGAGRSMPAGATGSYCLVCNGSSTTYPSSWGNWWYPGEPSIPACPPPY